jgi:transaldolase
MRRQALKIRDWQDNVYVKIPITNTKAEPAIDLIRDLAAEGVKLNVTAVLTRAQVEAVAGALNREIPSVVSVFAGRVADTGVDPLPLMKESLELISALPKAEAHAMRAGVKCSTFSRRRPAGAYRHVAA